MFQPLLVCVVPPCSSSHLNSFLLICDTKIRLNYTFDLSCWFHSMQTLLLCSFAYIYLHVWHCVIWVFELLCVPVFAASLGKHEEDSFIYFLPLCPTRGCLNLPQLTSREGRAQFRKSSGHCLIFTLMGTSVFSSGLSGRAQGAYTHFLGHGLRARRLPQLVRDSYSSYSTERWEMIVWHIKSSIFALC